MSDIVLVTGPPLSGFGAVAAALRSRLDGCTVEVRGAASRLPRD